MSKKFQLSDYETVKPTSRQRNASMPVVDDCRARALPVAFGEHKSGEADAKNQADDQIAEPPRSIGFKLAEHWSEKKGHGLSFVGVFLFTLLVYFRPYELFPSLAWLSKSALVAAILTLVIFVPTQLGLENRLTIRPREVNLALLLLVTGALSIPLALEPARALQSFIEYCKVIVMFIVMVNVLRNEKRLRALILLVLAASCVLSAAAFADYLLGNLALQGRRIAGVIGGLFSNPNDLALHLVTMIPIAFALMFSSRSITRKALYLGCSMLLLAGLMATFSRGGFLGLMCVAAFMFWKLAHRNRALFGGVAVMILLMAIALAPSAYRSRLSTTSDDSAVARTDDLKRSILVAASHPLLGVGMDNYILFSNTNKATHNAYTQVAAEMGFASLIIYLAFLISPLRKLRKLEASLRAEGNKTSLYYLAIGLQASMVGYMVVSFFASVAFLWYAYYLVAYCICLRRIASNSVAASSPVVNSSYETQRLGDASVAERLLVVGGN